MWHSDKPNTLIVLYRARQTCTSIQPLRSTIDIDLLNLMYINNRPWLGETCKVFRTNSYVPGVYENLHVIEWRERRYGEGYTMDFLAKTCLFEIDACLGKNLFMTFDNCFHWYEHRNVHTIFCFVFCWSIDHRRFTLRRIIRSNYAFSGHSDVYYILEHSRKWVHTTD